jgi:hypothetical protein
MIDAAVSRIFDPMVAVAGIILAIRSIAAGVSSRHLAAVKKEKT